MFCPNCGAQISEGHQFCGNCGSPLPQPDPVSQDFYEDYTNGGGPQVYDGDPGNGGGPKPKKFLIGAIAAAAVVVIAVVAVVASNFGSGSKGSGDSILPDAADNTIDAVLDRDEVLEYLTDYVSSDAIGVSLSADGITTLLSNAGMDATLASALDPAVTLEAAVNANSMKGSLSADLEIMGTTYTVDLYISGDTIALSVPAFYDSTLYLDMENITEDLDASVFAPSSGSDYALDSESYSALVELAENYSALMASSSGSTNALEAYVDALEEEELLPVFESEKGEVTVGGESVSCTVNTAQITYGDLASILYFTEDWYEEQLTEEGVALLEEMDIDISDLSKYASQLASDDSYLIVEYDVKNNYMIRFDVQVVTVSSYGTYTDELAVEFGTNPAKTDEIIITVYDDGDADMVYTLEIEEDSNSIEISLSSANAGVSYGSTIFTYERDLKTGEFEILSGLVSGTAVISGSKLTISDLSVYAYSLGDISLTLDRSASVESLNTSNALNLLEMSESELEDLVDDISDEAQSLYYSFSGLTY